MRMISFRNLALAGCFLGIVGVGACGGGNGSKTGGAGSGGSTAGSAGSGAGGDGGSAPGGSGGSVGAGGDGGSAAGGAGGAAGVGGAAGMAVTCDSFDGGVEDGVDGGGPLPDSVTFLTGVTVGTLTGGANDGAMNGAPGTGLLNNPVSIVLEPAGTLAISDFDNDRLRRSTTAGTLSTLTMQQDFSRPFGLAITAGTLYAATDANPDDDRDETTGTIWRINGNTGLATVVARDLGWPRGLAGLSDGRLVLADGGTKTIRILNPATGAVTELAGLRGCPGARTGTGMNARFIQPIGIAVLPGDRIIVADRQARVLREVTLAGVVTTFAGDGIMGTIDGPRTSSRFVAPKALTVDASGALYVADDLAHRIRRIAADGTVTTVAGNGEAGFRDGVGDSAIFYGMEGITVAADGSTLYVADGTAGEEDPGPYHRIRKITIGP